MLFLYFLSLFTLIEIKYLQCLVYVFTTSWIFPHFGVLSIGIQIDLNDLFTTWSTYFSVLWRCKIHFIVTKTLIRTTKLSFFGCITKYSLQLPESILCRTNFTAACHLYQLCTSWDGKFYPFYFEKYLKDSPVDWKNWMVCENKFSSFATVFQLDLDLGFD